MMIKSKSYVVIDSDIENIIYKFNEVFDIRKNDYWRSIHSPRSKTCSFEGNIIVFNDYKISELNDRFGFDRGVLKGFLTTNGICVRKARSGVAGVKPFWSVRLALTVR